MSRRKRPPQRRAYPRPREGFPSTVFGATQWHTLYLMAANYNPETQADAVRRTILDLPVLLPCAKCRASCAKKLRTLGFMTPEGQARVLASRDSLFQFIYDFQQAVNRPMRSSWNDAKGKDAPSLTEVRRTYERLRYCPDRPKFRVVIRFELDHGQPAFDFNEAMCRLPEGVAAWEAPLVVVSEGSRNH